MLLGPLAHALNAGENRFEWSVLEHNHASLSYAEPESDVGVVWMSCERPPEIEVVPTLPAEGLKEGRRGLIKLSGPDAELILQGKAFQSEIEGEGILLAGRLPDARRLLPLFSRDGSLSIEVPGNAIRIPINRQARDALAEFLEHCPSSR